MSSDTSRRRLRSWKLRTLLLLFIPLCAAVALYGQFYRQRQLAVEAFHLMQSKGGDANFRNGLERAVYTFKHGNVTDADLDAFVPAFNGYAPAGFGRIETLRLNGSQVSADAVRRFRRRAPDCELEL